jgi:quinoprotein glucose dehydrogenase
MRIRHATLVLVLLAIPGVPAFADGAALFQQHCALCHGQNMGGGEAGPPLRGRAFMRKWSGQSQALFELTRRTMPVTQPGGLSQSDYSQLTALMMSGGDMAAAGAPGVATAAPTSLPPVPDTEWLHHRGDAGSRNYSPLAQIDAGNVARLQVAWRWHSDNFGTPIWPNLETTPLMARGVLYATVGASRSVVAIDARSGETLWMYRMDGGARGAVAPRNCGAKATVTYCSSLRLAFSSSRSMPPRDGRSKTSAPRE